MTQETTAKVMVISRTPKRSFWKMYVAIAAILFGAILVGGTCMGVGAALAYVFNTLPNNARVFVSAWFGIGIPFLWWLSCVWDAILNKADP